MNWSRSKVAAEGQKNVTLQVTGAFESPQKGMVILDTEEHFKQKSRLRLDSLLWVIQEKMTLLLYWDEPSQDGFIMPMESRNFVRLDRGLVCPKEWQGKLCLSAINTERTALDIEPKHFLLLFDFDKL